MEANSDGELHRNSLNNELCNAILTGDEREISFIKTVRSADSPLHAPTGLLMDGHPQDGSILPIHLAAIYRQAQSLEALLRSGADPETRDKHGCNALHLVIAHWPKANRILPKPGSKLETKMAAREQQSEACLRMLCRSGVDVNALERRDSEHTAMHLAVRYGALPAVDILASHGANVHTADRWGMLPLHMAAGTLNTDMVASLLRHGADANRATGQSGSTALHLAVLAAMSTTRRDLPIDLSCVNLMLAHGANPNLQNKAGWTPLHDACRMGQKELADLLLRHGADVNIQTSLGENCLFQLLDRTANLECTWLLDTLLRLTYPRIITNNQGALPQALLLPEHRDQREALMQLCKQPLSLQETCRIHIHRQYGERSRLQLREMLPERLHSFLYSSWDCASGVLFPGAGRSDNDERPGDLPSALQI
ncbi:hypothetical protein GJAV_G00262270 [Gymnothorax javanicus]|nr:hypothetical protein GJAV_G00262270 [Gymnothorax javanicus]